MSSGVSKGWAIVITCVAFLSTIDVTRNFKGDFAFQFNVTSVTAVIIALAWLPSLLHAILLTGGAVKTPAGEANTRGILDLLGRLAPEMRRETLRSLAAGLDSAELAAETHQERGEARAARRDVEQELRDSIKPNASSEEALDEYSRLYEELRSTLPPGDERTFQMSSLTAEVRAVASYMGITPQIVKKRFSSGRPGDRVVALTLLEAVPLPQCLDEILDGIAESRSAFEQFQALRAAEEVLPQLGAADRRRLAECLEAALHDPERAIDEDASRLLPVEQMLADIERLDH